MKKIKFNLNKIITALLIIAILLGTAVIISQEIGTEKIKAYFSVFSYPNEFNSDKLPMSRHNYNTLSETEKQAYICIFNNIESHPEYIKIPGLTKDEFNNVYFAVKNDNPNMLCFNDSCLMVIFWSSCFVQLNYENDASECKAKQDTMLKKVDSILAEMPEFNDDFSKELYIHDYIINTCTYKETKSSSSAYGCLIEGKAVCSGYSRAAMLLLNSAGIDSMLIAGVGQSQAQGSISHMWNIVWLDSKPYHLDVTWDDPDTEENGIISHLYFNLTDEEISKDHTDYTISGQCTDSEYNYFKYYEMCFDSYSQSSLDVIKIRLVNNINNGINYVEFEFSDDVSYQKAVSELIDNTSHTSDIYDILSYVSKYAADKVDVTHINFSRDDNKRYIRMMFDFL